MLQKFILLVNYSIITNNYCLSTSVLGVSCGFSIDLPQTVEALQGSCVFIPCTFDIDQQYEDLLTDTAKRMWYKDETLVFDSSSPDTGLFKGEIFGTATQKNCSTRFDNVKQNHNGSYYFRLETNGILKYNYREPKHFRVQIVVLGECYIVHASSILWLYMKNKSTTEQYVPSLYNNQHYLVISLCVFQDLHPNPHW